MPQRRDEHRARRPALYDPLWLLARQWQIGEFQGEDNGSPAAAQWHGESARFTRYAPGALADRAAVAGQAIRRPRPSRSRRSSSANRCDRGPTALERLRLAADAGRHFLRVLGQQFTVARLRRRRARGVPVGARSSDAERQQLDAESLAFVASDGRDVRPTGGSCIRPSAHRFVRRRRSHAFTATGS